jgi:hypothetical protein
MIESITNLVILIGICLVIYLVSTNFDMKEKEGLTTLKTSVQDVDTPGVADQAVQFVKKLEAELTQLKDKQLINKYKHDYQHIISTTDDLIDHLMLDAVVSIDVTKPFGRTSGAPMELFMLNQTKESLHKITAFLEHF